MGAKDLDRLIGDCGRDPALRSAMAAADPLDAAKAARENGYDITPDEAAVCSARLDGAAPIEMSGSQLDAVAGGKGPPNWPANNSALPRWPGL